MTSRKIIVISTRPPVAPLSGGMAPAVKNACEAFDDVTWYAVCNKDGLTSRFNNPSTPIIESLVEGMKVKQIVVDGEVWDDHYNKASNSVLWPLCHDRYDIAASFGMKEFFGTLYVNKMMADRVDQDLSDDHKTPIWIHDYHHLPLARFLRAIGRKNPIVLFNHIPLPNPEKVKQLPEKDRVHLFGVLEGLHCCDAVNFQTAETARRFMTLMGHEPKDLKPYEEAIVRIPDGNGGRALHIGHYPISVPTARIMRKATDLKPFSPEAQALSERLVAPNILINFERADYSKGILPRLRAFSTLMENHPEYRGQVQLVIGAEPTRGDIEEYRAYAQQVREEITTINEKWADSCGHDPVVLLPKHIPNDDVLRLMRNDKENQRKIITVTSYRDGMNLVAKEGAAAQDPDNAGVVVVSGGTGAGMELYLDGRGALTYDPDDDEPHLLPDQKARPIYKAMIQAIEMPQDEANERAKVMQAHLLHHDIALWGQRHREQFGRISRPEPAIDCPLLRSAAASDRLTP